MISWTIPRSYKEGDARAFKPELHPQATSIWRTGATRRRISGGPPVALERRAPPGSDGASPYTLKMSLNHLQHSTVDEIGRSDRIAGPFRTEEDEEVGQFLR
jgi:hypothetical protein